MILKTGSQRQGLTYIEARDHDAAHVYQSEHEPTEYHYRIPMVRSSTPYHSCRQLLNHEEMPKDFCTTQITYVDHCSSRSIDHDSHFHLKDS